MAGSILDNLFPQSTPPPQSLMALQQVTAYNNQMMARSPFSMTPLQQLGMSFAPMIPGMLGGGGAPTFGMPFGNGTGYAARLDQQAMMGATMAANTAGMQALNRNFLGNLTGAIGSRFGGQAEQDFRKFGQWMGGVMSDPMAAQYLGQIPGLNRVMQAIQPTFGLPQAMVGSLNANGLSMQETQRFLSANTGLGMELMRQTGWSGDQWSPAGMNYGISAQTRLGLDRMMRNSGLLGRMNTSGNAAGIASSMLSSTQGILPAIAGLQSQFGDLSDSDKLGMLQALSGGGIGRLSDAGINAAVAESAMAQRMGGWSANEVAMFTGQAAMNAKQMGISSTWMATAARQSLMTSGTIVQAVRSASPYGKALDIDTDTVLAAQGKLAMSNAGSAVATRGAAALLMLKNANVSLDGDDDMSRAFKALNEGQALTSEQSRMFLGSSSGALASFVAGKTGRGTGEVLSGINDRNFQRLAQNATNNSTILSASKTSTSEILGMVNRFAGGALDGLSTDNRDLAIALLLQSPQATGAQLATAAGDNADVANLFRGMTERQIGRLHSGIMVGARTTQGLSDVAAAQRIGARDVAIRMADNVSSQKLQETLLAALGQGGLNPQTAQRIQEMLKGGASLGQGLRYGLGVEGAEDLKERLFNTRTGLVNDKMAGLLEEKLSGLTGAERESTIRAFGSAIGSTSEAIEAAVKGKGRFDRKMIQSLYHDTRGSQYDLKTLGAQSEAGKDPLAQGLTYGNGDEVLRDKYGVKVTRGSLEKEVAVNNLVAGGVRGLGLDRMLPELAGMETAESRYADYKQEQAGRDKSREAAVKKKREKDEQTMTTAADRLGGTVDGNAIRVVIVNHDKSAIRKK